MSAPFDTDVLIVGAGPAGLSLATELTMRGVSAIVVEQNERVGVQPRAKTTNVRTMEHMRRWGLSAHLRSLSPIPEDVPRRVRFATSLFGGDIMLFENSFCAARRRDDRFSENAEWIPQYTIEKVLLEHVTRHPKATVKLRHKFVDFTQDADGVTARVTDLAGDKTFPIRARYLVGADGGRSPVRAQLGIAMQGQSGIASFVTLILKIPGLSADPALKPALMHWLVDPAAPCIMGPMDRDDTWFFNPSPKPGGPGDDAEVLRDIRHMLGGHYEFTVLAKDLWTAHKLLADRYSDGRVFLAGDACHLHSPFGGHGMNFGIGDSVDLGWKLAATLQGWGGPGLLDSYEIERRPVHQRVLDSATENLGSLSAHFSSPELLEDSERGEAARHEAGRAVEKAKTPEFRSLGLVLGYSYAGSPIVAREANDPPQPNVVELRPSGYPGERAPHAWLADGRSIYDLFGLGFTLLVTGDATAQDIAAAKTEAARQGVPLEVATPGEARFNALYGARLVLIRPDQHIAWRGDKFDDFAAVLLMARGGKTNDQQQASPLMGRRHNA
ncbi:MAG: FAD-dependent monooxygenase [Pseudolabrys sp.]|jgi:2-polyprenyl-6-methoxyphenol hydroxylase-like FAD-dependent oxidoreductase